MNNLKELVAIRSDQNCDEIVTYIKNRLKTKVKEVQIFEKNGVKILIAGINVKLYDVSPIVLSGHIDTVSANEKYYNTDPFALTEKDGKMYGLGSIDMKSFMAVILDNIDKLKNFDVPLVLALTTDEETKLNGIEFVIEKLKELKITPRFTILGEPTKSEFNIFSNACYEYNVKFFGKACHSSKPEDGVNAICACAKLIDYIERRQKVYRITSNCGVINGGEVVNIVPDYAELSFDIRSIYLSDVKNFIVDINKCLDRLTNKYPGLKTRLTKMLEIPALNCDGNVKIKKIAEELKININKFSGSCEAGYYTEYSGDAVIFGVGDLALAHKPNEYVVIEEYRDYSKKLINVLDKIKEYYSLVQ